MRLTFDTPLDLAHTRVNVFTVNHEPVEIGPLHTTTDPLSVAADLPALTPG